MFAKPTLLVTLFSLTPFTMGREVFLERHGKAVLGRALVPRRFGQEQCGGLPQQIGAACRGEVCGVLGGKSINTLLAAAPECAQQDLADDIIDASKNEDATTAAKMVKLATEFRQCEKNTPPDFTTNPPALRNSVFCQKAPRNPQLNGLVQAQDPANDPNLFFDPATKSTVIKGSQPNTSAFGGAGTPAPNTSSESTTVSATACSAPVVVTVTVTNPAATVSSTTTTALASTTAPTDTKPDTKPISPGSLDLGGCTDPTVEFGPAFEGRKLSENSFKPVNKAEFPQGSALNAEIVFNAICNILADRCKAPVATVDACKSGAAAAQNLQGGAQADAFNTSLGFKTDFADVPAAPGGGPGTPALANTANFNKCTNQTIVFGPGFDGRKEDSFQPANKTDFNHGSALNPKIITQFICDSLVNTCDANQKAIDNCKAAQIVVDGLSGQTFVDAFNRAVTA